NQFGAHGVEGTHDFMPLRDWFGGAGGCSQAEEDEDAQAVHERDLLKHGKRAWSGLRYGVHSTAIRSTRPRRVSQFPDLEYSSKQSSNFRPACIVVEVRYPGESARTTRGDCHAGSGSVDDVSPEWWCEDRRGAA